MSVTGSEFLGDSALAPVVETATMNWEAAMQSMSLRYFQREGSKALEGQGVAEPVLLTGRDQEYLLLPV
ncbi:MAG: hypothetical protein JST16_12835, partial [Bdellovibrionales bacterium]|nr:hypothetical protein [Bdellovibrionales bacterium]